VLPARARCWLAALALAWAQAAAAQTLPDQTLDEHGGPIIGIAVSADGRQALTASFDYSVILWDLATGQPLAQLYGHDAAVNDVAFLEGGRALSASDDGTLAIWDLASAQLIARLEGHQGKVAGLAVGPQGLAASAGWDGTVRVWDLAKQAQLLELPAGDRPNTVRFSRDGTRILAGLSDGSIRIWRTADGVQQAVLHGHDFAVTGLDLAVDGRHAASSSVDETVQLWDLDQGAPTQTLYGHEGPVLAVALSADRDLVASRGRIVICHRWAGVAKRQV
jgi:cytochrome c